MSADEMTGKPAERCDERERREGKEVEMFNGSASDPKDANNNMAVSRDSCLFVLPPPQSTTHFTLTHPNARVVILLLASLL